MKELTKLLIEFHEAMTKEKHDGKKVQLLAQYENEFEKLFSIDPIGKYLSKIQKPLPEYIEGTNLNYYCPACGAIEENECICNENE